MPTTGNITHKLDYYQILPLLILIISAFGIQLTSTIRCDHVVIYVFFIFSIIILAKEPKMLVVKPLFYILIFLIFEIVWTTTVTCFSERDLDFIKVLAKFENYLQPIALIIIVMVFVRNNTAKQIEQLIGMLCRTFIILLLLNTIIILIDRFYDISSWITYWFITERSHVSALARLNERYSGIFDQPIDAGTSYSLGIVVWVYLFRKNYIRGLKDYLSLAVIFIGGFFPSSKAYFFCGIPLFFIYLIWGKTKNYSLLKIINWRMIVLIFFAICSAYLLSIMDIIKFDKFTSYFDTTLYQQTNILSRITATRYGSGEESRIVQNYNYVKQYSLLYGVGFAGGITALDSAFMEFFVQGGVVAGIIYIAVILTISLHGLVNYKNYEECHLLLIVSIIIVGAGLGSAIITMNRFSVIMWALVVLIFIYCKKCNNQKNAKMNRNISVPVLTQYHIPSIDRHSLDKLG